MLYYLSSVILRYLRSIHLHIYRTTRSTATTPRLGHARASGGSGSACSSLTRAPVRTRARARASESGATVATDGRVSDVKSDNVSEERSAVESDRRYRARLVVERLVASQARRHRERSGGIARPTERPTLLERPTLWSATHVGASSNGASGDRSSGELRTE